MAAKGSSKGLAWLKDHVTYVGDQCLIWPFSRDRDGYGQFGHDGKIRKSHRWMCEAANGPAPTPDHFAAHNCGNGHLGCAHPKHLEWKTQLENAQDMIVHGTSRRGPHRRVKLTPYQIAEIKALKGVKNDRELAPLYGVTSRTIRMIFQGRIWKDKSKLKSFSDETVQLIRSLKGQRSAKELAAEHGVSLSVIYKIWLRQSWIHVPEAA